MTLWLILMPLNIFFTDFWPNTSSENRYLFGISQAHADQKTDRTARCTLKTIWGGRYERYASIVFQFSKPIQLQSAGIENREIRFRLNNVTTCLNSFRKYKTFDSWVTLKKVENDLEIRIGFPEGFKTYDTLMLDKPYRLVINLYDSKISTLETIWGGRHGRHPAVVFQFSKQIKLPSVQIENREMRLQFTNVTTDLPPTRRYTTFDSWVTLEKNKQDLNVGMKIPVNYSKPRIVELQNPPRLAVHFYKSIPGSDSKPQVTIYDHKKESCFAIPSDTARAKDEITVPLPEKLPRPSSAKAPSFLGDEKQMGLIEARILSRQGLYEKSLKIYQHLRHHYPRDEEVWEDYIETLVNYADYDLAQDEINLLLRKNPSSLRGLRIQARIFNELNQYRWAYEVYEKILSQYRKDAGVWADYANTGQGAGEWATALNYYCKALEIDPENKAVRRSIHEILREHRPRLETSYRADAQEGGNTDINTFTLNYTAPLGQSTRLDAGYAQIDIQRSRQPGIAAVDQSVEDVIIRVHHEIDRHWQATVGGGTYRGLGDRDFFLFGFDYRIDTSAQIQTDYARHRPWYDPVDAANYKGYFNRGTVRFDKSFDNAWGLYLEASQYDYVVNDATNYGQKRTFTGILSRRIWEHPDVSASYSFYRSAFGYDNINFTPVAVLASESVHSLNLNLEHRLCTYWTCSLTGGLRRDTSRSLGSWYVFPGIKIRLGNRIETGLNYEYSSESQTVGGGETETLNIRAKIIF